MAARLRGRRVFLFGGRVKQTWHPCRGVIASNQINEIIDNKEKLYQILQILNLYR